MTRSTDSIHAGVFAALTLLLGLLSGCASEPDRAAASEDPSETAALPPPSIVLILADDLGWADIALQGSAWPTPAIDALAADGVRFTRAASNAPNCAPSRACLMTGTDVAAHGIHTVHPAARGKAKDRKLVPPPTRRRLADEAITIAEMLAPAGYVSAHIGKWHLGEDPASQGFDVAIAGNLRGSPHRHLAPWELPALEEGEDGAVLADALTEAAADFVRKSSERPFLLVLSHYAVHTPVQAPPAETARWAERLPGEPPRRHRYAAMVDSVDRSVQRIRDVLEECGRTDRTLLIFTSDNGGHERFTDNGPLRGGKGMLFEGGVRVPMIATGAGIEGAGRVVEEPILLSDLVPTFLELAAIEAPRDVPLIGRSLVPLLEGTGTLGSRDLIWHFPAYLGGYTPAHGTWRTTPAAAIQRDGNKLIEFFEDGTRLLFDLNTDPSETRNRIDDSPEIAADLAARLERWRDEREPPMPQPKD